eukprot:CAMPEP_0119338988 /NCGR_PEP_ID=MMETSP1333-20130426/97319_1 /TAXON_ID=418940 /ORGANISM="Scyphosphaera apsteinii, Strain RCC1455" /LENGTH=88 /DNA_ID=CAMNT_0007350419 /DNA_START=1065 /DNA_END=1331 /DNA_ORIENTATION=-
MSSALGGELCWDDSSRSTRFVALSTQAFFPHANWAQALHDLLPHVVCAVQPVQLALRPKSVADVVTIPSEMYGRPSATSWPMHATAPR